MTRGDSTKTSSTPAYAYKTYFYEKPVYHYVLILVVVISLLLSFYSLFGITELKKSVPKTVDVNDFLKKLTAHNEMKGYVGVAPLNIIQVTSNNLANLQSQISGLDASYLGNFIIQYTDRIAVYDYNNDKIKGTLNLQKPQQGQTPADLFAKLNKHTELQGLENEQPIGGQLDESSLSTLKQQFSDVYANAKVGDFLLRYKTRLIIYDYNTDRIVNVVGLG